MKHIFIINPIAGKGRTLKLVPEIHHFFEGSGQEYQIEVTEHPGHATKIAAKHVGGEPCRIYSVGGDGTLNEVLNGMAGSNCSLAVIPSGSGNDFIRSLPSAGNMESILERTIRGTEKDIDLARVNDRYFINMSSIGFDALAAYNTIRFKKVPLVSGSLAYILGILATIIGYTNNPIVIEIDGRRQELKSLLANVANGRYCGGGMLASPNAELDDGLLDICLAGAMNRFQVLTLFPKFMKGEHGQLKGVSFDRGQKVVIQARKKLAMHIDGEVTLTDRAEFQIIPGGLKIVVPEEAAKA